MRGASKGEGLGNQFLANIRECDAIAHVLRCFEDADVTHVEGRVDPLADAETVETELMLADLESVEKRIAGLQRKLKGGDKEAAAQARLLEAAKAALAAGRPARSVAVAGRGRAGLAAAAAPDREAGALRLQRRGGGGRDRQRAVGGGGGDGGGARGRGGGDLGGDRGGDRPARRRRAGRVSSAELGLEEAGLDRMIHEAYRLLGLSTYFTAGPKEARAWTIPAGASAPEAAGVIHGDFERGFIRAETVAYDDYVALGGEAGAREAGKLRAEGKGYRVQDGDVLHFLFNA